MNIYPNAEALIGHTPLVRLSRLAAGLPATVLVKLESRNPGGSAKDRVALSMLNAAETSGLLAPGGTVIEPTSGNTGIGLALMAAQRGYKAIIVMPDSMSPERIALMRAYGAEVVLTPGAAGMSGAIARAEELHAGIPGSFIPDQFSNQANPAAHYAATGPEIWSDTGGSVDIFVAGVGTGGTVTGVGRYLKEQDPRIRIVGVEPAGSPVLSGGKPGRHGLQGIGAGFIPKALDISILDQIIPVTEEQAYAAARRLGRTEGILCGISSGAALHAALTLAAMEENRGKTVVALLPDSGERYLSTALFNQ